MRGVVLDRFGLIIGIVAFTLVVLPATVGLILEKHEYVGNVCGILVYAGLIISLINLIPSVISYGRGSKYSLWLMLFAIGPWVAICVLIVASARVSQERGHAHMSVFAAPSEIVEYMQLVVIEDKTI